MPTWVEDTHLANRLLTDMNTELVQSGTERAKGIHVSQLIYCLTRSYYDQVSPLPLNPGETLLFSTGLGLEAVLLRPHRKAATGETEGIHWSVDGLDYEELTPLSEFKSTRLSANRGPEDLPATWVKQLLAYMYGTGEGEAILAILHLMGSYAPPFPTLKCWHMYATKEEIQANWGWLQKRKKILEEHLAKGIQPKQFTYNEDWECTTGPCRYLLICQARQSIEDLRKQLGEQAQTEA